MAASRIRIAASSLRLHLSMLMLFRHWVTSPAGAEEQLRHRLAHRTENFLESAEPPLLPYPPGPPPTRGCARRSAAPAGGPAAGARRRISRRRSSWKESASGGGSSSATGFTSAPP